MSVEGRFTKEVRRLLTQNWFLSLIILIIRGESLDDVRKQEYGRLSGKGRSYIKGQKYTLLSNQENLDLSGRQALKKLLGANKRLNAAYLLKESFG